MRRDHNDLAAVGIALFGDTWQSSLARALKVEPRTVRRWADGAPIPDRVWNDIAVLCDKRAGALLEWVKRIEIRL